MAVWEISKKIEIHQQKGRKVKGFFVLRYLRKTPIEPFHIQPLYCTLT